MKLLKTEIEKHLKNKFVVMTEETVSSTNTILKEQAKNGAQDRTVLVASSQTAGRGRLGRSFYSPDNSGIYMSVLLRPEKDLDCRFVTPMTAVIVCRALERFGAGKLGIKWVNDIYLDNKKVCGILTEIGFKEDTGKVDFLIIGIGINLTTSDFPDEISGIAGSVFEKEMIDKNKLIADILDELILSYNKLSELEFLEEYKERSVLKNKTVSVITPTEQKSAEVLGIDDECRLIVKLSDGEILHLCTGEVSIKIQNG